MKEIILGTAGHIDHGKTSLIKAITGINTDRLKEEQERGITIELGFASIKLSHGQHLGIVDVPGHEKFVKNMVAGATGIDLVAMIIAADEGVMPQTREHLDICSLLGVQYGLVVLTKIDMVDQEWLDLVLEDVMEFTTDTFLEKAPIVQVSSTTREGLSEFVKTLEQLCASIPSKLQSGLMRLPVDRVFSMKGFGTVITGSLISGRIRTDDVIMLYPSGITSKVRGIQVHNQSVEAAFSGQRTAVNFQGLDRAVVKRGDVLSGPHDLVNSYMLDASFDYLASNTRPLKNRAKIRFHSGTSEIAGLIILLEKDVLKPGETGLVQIRLDQPVSLVRDDRFVTRAYSPVRTIGGGKIINPVPQKARRFFMETITHLNQLLTGPREDNILLYCHAAEHHGLSFKELKLMTNLSEKQMEAVIGGLLSRQHLIQTDREQRVYMHHAVIKQLDKDIRIRLETYHHKNPLRSGMPKEELKSKFPAYLSGRLFNLIIERMIKENHIKQNGELVHLHDHQVVLAVDTTAISNKISSIYQKSGLTPPYFKDICRSLKLETVRARDILGLLVKQGHIIKAKEDLYFNTDVIKNLQIKLIEFLKKNGEITPPEFKKMTGLSRKYLIPLLEYYDSVHVTIRIGDSRKLRKGSSF